MKEAAGPLAIEFANTRYAVRGREREGLETPHALSTWLREHSLPADAGESDLPAFIGLRDAIRALLHATAEGEPLPTGAVDVVNDASARAARAPLLADSDGGWGVIELSAADPLDQARGTVARGAVLLIGGDQRQDVRACHAPGCVQYFVKDHPRREWCSTSCGNRARVARHYSKQRER
ncbi:ABATE domain-containing protein [Catenulispora sp. NF23]|uniref:ABATE domain-containing protein n=1 Tax=Catenulispora pinistramenti TaxID=2705254 RepID=A0ABS5KU66_9ACTN|nr:CGNR zinc finger domain-containing protein [Catenulispora pinistramenti]MBS2539470.1 ABATE domain-containing protein [Catenulispora pinistramenti]MBS2549587.1 ABATE domain-containing protein [Catenulispora pinistramenti]